jgi:hypothetical protein
MCYSLPPGGNIGKIRVAFDIAKKTGPKSLKPDEGFMLARLHNSTPNLQIPRAPSTAQIVGESSLLLYFGSFFSV